MGKVRNTQLPSFSSFSINNCCQKASSHVLFSFSPNDNIIHESKLKAFADGKIYVAEKLKYVAEKLKFVFGRVKNILGEGENAGYKHFLLFPHCKLSKGLFLNLFPNKPWFLRVCSTFLSFGKHYGKRRNCS